MRSKLYSYFHKKFFYQSSKSFYSFIFQLDHQSNLYIRRIKKYNKNNALYYKNLNLNDPFFVIDNKNKINRF